jgi:hypothetical protein
MKESEELLTRLRNYVTHSAKVYSSTNALYRKNTRYEHIIDRIAFCRSLINGLNKFMGLKYIACEVLIIKKQLEDILPCEINHSYEHSRQEYNNIIDYCERSLKQ